MRTSTKMATAAMVAAVGMGATATAASAYAFDPPSTHFTGTPTGPQSLTVGAGTWTCSTMTLTGDTGVSSGAMQVQPSYASCTLNAFGVSFSSTVMMRADWRITLDSGSGPWSASLDLLAPGSGPTVQLNVPALGCEIDLGPQSGLSNVAVSNTPLPGVQLDFAVAGITYTQNGSCPFATSSTASYQGTVAVPGITATN